MIGRNVTAAYSKNSPRLLHTPAKFEKNPPSGDRVMRKTKRGARYPPMHKQGTLNQGLTMTLHAYIPKLMSLASINFLHLTVSGI